MEETKEVQKQRELLSAKYRRVIPMAGEIWHHFKDWKLFRKMLPDWQERYMEKLIKEYETILVSDADASDKFWKLEKRIRKDKKKSGVCVTDMSRSQMFANIMELLDEKTITLDDLEGFSDSLRERLELLHR